MMEAHISCSLSNKVAAAQLHRVLSKEEQVELIDLDDEIFLKGYITDNRFDADVENLFVHLGKFAMIQFYRDIHGLTEVAKQIFNLRFGNLL